MKAVKETLTVLKKYIKDLNEAVEAEINTDKTKDTEYKESESIENSEHENKTRTLFENTVKCTLCKQVFTKEDEKTRHFKTMHTTKYKCTFVTCTQTFADQKMQEAHETVHSLLKKKLKNCSKCSKTFRFKSELDYHKKSHSDKSISHVPNVTNNSNM